MSRSLGPLLLQNMSLPNNRCTQMIPLRPCTSRPHTQHTCLHRAPTSPRCKCSLRSHGYRQVSPSEPGRRRNHQLLPRFSTSLRNMPCMGLQHLQSSRHCTGIPSKLCSALASSSLPDSCCNHHLLSRSCTCLRRTPCTCLRQVLTIQRCKCSCSKLCSAQVNPSLPGSCYSSHLLPCP